MPTTQEEVLIMNTKFMHIKEFLAVRSLFLILSGGKRFFLFYLRLPTTSHIKVMSYLSEKWYNKSNNNVIITIALKQFIQLVPLNMQIINTHKKKLKKALELEELHKHLNFESTSASNHIKGTQKELENSGKTRIEESKDIHEHYLHWKF